MVTSPMGTASNCFARSLGADSTSSPGSSPVAGIHLYTLLLFFPSAGVHLRGAREEEEEEEEGGGRGEPRFRAPARFRLERAGGRCAPDARLGLDDSLLLPVPDAPIQDLRLRAGGLALAARRHRSRALAGVTKKPKKHSCGSLDVV